MLREAGLRLHTLAEVYGVRAEVRLGDDGPHVRILGRR